MKKFLPVIALCLFGVSCHQNSDVQYTRQDARSDREITRKVKRSILTDRTLDPSNRLVSITTTDGVVEISGNVANKDQMKGIVKKAKGVPGVQHVDNQMTLSDS